MPSPNVTQAVPFFGVRDIEASVRFYVDGLGFTKTIEWTPEGKLRWCWLELGEAALMLQEDAQLPGGKLGEGVSIVFMCRDAIAIYHELTARNIDASRPFVGNGLWVTTLTDPDGYQLQFESPTDAPEESVHSG